MNDLARKGAEGVQTMSSREIAELVEKRHDHVLRDIRNMLVSLYGESEVDEGLPDRDKYEAFFDKMGWGIDSPDLGNGRVKGIRVSRDGRGFIAQISLDYNHTMTLISGYKVKLRKAIIDKWQELESQAHQPIDPMKALNDPATMRGLLLSYSEKVLQLENQNAELTPKAEALDRIAQANGSLCVTDAAKALQMRPKDLFSWLQANHWIYRRPGNASWLGYQDKVQIGYLEHKLTTVTTSIGEDRINEQVRVTPKGMARLAERFGVDPPQ